VIFDIFLDEKPLVQYVYRNFFIPIFTKKLREKMGRMEHYVWVALTAELDETLERLAREGRAEIYVHPNVANAVL
jgi:hypothetical protein